MKLPRAVRFLVKEMTIMRKRWTKAGLILIAMLVLLSGCSKDKAETTADKKEETTEAKEEKTETKSEAQTEAEETNKRDEEMKSGSGSATAPEQKSPETFYVYHSNPDADELIKEEVEVDEISPEAVLKALIDAGALTEDIKINSLQEAEKDGEKVLDVDFSQEFAELTSSMGSTGEYMIMGSVCNTFLDAYGCKKIHITVEGGILSTGHNEYPGYLGFYELQ